MDLLKYIYVYVTSWIYCSIYIFMIFMIPAALHCRTDAAFLLRFLRARKFDSDRALHLLVNYLNIRALHGDILGQLLPSKSALDTGFSIVLPNKDSHGRTIIYIRIGNIQLE